MRRLTFILSLLLACLCASARECQLFDKGWLFYLADTQSQNKDFSSSTTDDRNWRSLSLPHDWAVEGDFSASNPSGAGGGALPGGIGWYRKHFVIDKADKGEKFFIRFDGVYMNSTVYINGHKLGLRPYGYATFEYDMTPYIVRGGENVIAVKVDNSDQPNSRWYSGCGIYRHVWLTKTGSLRVPLWGTHVVPRLKGGNGSVDVTVGLVNETGMTTKVTVRNTILDARGRTVATKTSSVTVGKEGECTQTLAVKRPELWSVDRPYIYNVKTEVLQGNATVDTYETTTGFRTFVFDAAKGFSLNGKAMKLNGVCEHHDFGCLGAALSEDAMHRKLTILKNMGCNALRCSHNPPAPELLAMCDTMGLIVMDESFDMWRRRKTKGDYARFFDEWHERDLSDLVRRDRNHPSILIWSIGNEVLEQWSSAEADTLSLEQANLILNMGHDKSTLANDDKLSVNSLLTQHLAGIVKALDPTRPVTAGCNEPSPNNHLFKSGAMDLIGFNYHHEWVKDVPKNFPGKPFLFTESVSALQTRGHYIMPSDTVIVAPSRWDIPYTDPTFACSSYDNMHAPWSSTHEETWEVVKHSPFCSGQFIWTGFDYIGEPTPYGFPARSSYFGIIDLAGFPKDVYYLYQSEWTDKPVLHLFPHWNWIEGQTVDMWCYYNNADEVELFVNGRSCGTRAKVDSHQYHVMWQVPFQAGEVKAVARKDGKVVREQVIRTAGAPYAIRLTTDRSAVKSGGQSMAFVTVEVVDKDGTVCPRAAEQIHFSLSGDISIAGVDNGSPISMERFLASERTTLNGRCLVVLRSGDTKGNATLTAKGFGLQSATVSITVE